MTSRRMFVGSLFSVAAVPAVILAQSGNAANAQKKPKAAPALTASGASVIENNGEKVKIKIKCAKCGYQTAAIEIGIPTPGNPYSQQWTCPKCGHKQTVTVVLASDQA